MKFIYEYRTRDNVKCSGVFFAPKQADVYAALRAKGIRPVRVYDAPGIVNLILGKGKRWCAIGLLTLVLVIVVCFKHRQSEVGDELAIVNSFLASRVRRQIVGDVSVVQRGLRDGWKGVFANKADRYLAAYAIPATVSMAPEVTDDEIALMLYKPITLVCPDSVEARQLVAIVEGMKQELVCYLADGGTVSEYRKALADRLELELELVSRVKNEIENAVAIGQDRMSVEALWDARNADLRKIGIKPLPYPNAQD